MRVGFMLAVGVLEIYFYSTFYQQKIKIKTFRHERPVSARGSIYIYRRAQELCESRGGRPGLPVPNSPKGLCGRKATFEEEEEER